MMFRTDQESEQYGLSPEFFLDALQKGVTNFFGISVGNDGLEADEQNPEAFAKWQTQNIGGNRSGKPH
jgi:hypothetical protein